MEESQGLEFNYAMTLFFQLCTPAILDQICFSSRVIATLMVSYIGSITMFSY